MTRNQTARVHGCVERARPVSPSSESGSTATGRSRAPGAALETPTGASVAAGDGAADATGVVVTAAPGGGGVAAVPVGAAVDAGAAARTMSLETCPRASCGRQYSRKFPTFVSAGVV